MKKHTFTKAFRRKATMVMTNLGLVPSQTDRQTKNNTLFFYDPQTKDYYGFYESGYCRRFIPADMHWGSVSINGQNYKGYQLNQTTIECTVYFSCKKRILATPLEQLGIVTAAIINRRCQ